MSGGSKFETRERLATVRTVGALISNTVSKIRPETLAKRLDRLAHAATEEVVATCRWAGYSSQELEDEIKKLASNCVICASSGFPGLRKRYRYITSTKHLT